VAHPPKARAMRIILAQQGLEQFGFRGDVDVSIGKILTS